MHRSSSGNSQELMNGGTREHFSDTAAARMSEYLTVELKVLQNLYLRSRNQHILNHAQHIHDKTNHIHFKNPFSNTMSKPLFKLCSCLPFDPLS